MRSLVHLSCIAALSIAAIGGSSTALAQDEDTSNAQAATDACIPKADQTRPLSDFPKEKQLAFLSCVNRIVTGQLAKKLPMKVDNMTTLEAVWSEGTTVHYRYKLDMALADLGADAKTTIETGTRKNVCDSDDMAQTIGVGGSYGYTWLDREGKKIHSIVISSC